MSQTRDWFCGHLRAIGHGKDVIIRGGDNIPVVEVESLLCRHPANAMAAIVAYPDERLGERLRRGGAKPGQAIDPPRLVQILKDQKSICSSGHPRPPTSSIRPVGWLRRSMSPICPPKT